MAAAVKERQLRQLRMIHAGVRIPRILIRQNESFVSEIPFETNGRKNGAEGCKNRRGKVRGDWKQRRQRATASPAHRVSVMQAARRFDR